MVNFENTKIKEKKKKQIPSVYKEKIVNQICIICDEKYQVGQNFTF